MNREDAVVILKHLATYYPIYEVIRCGVNDIDKIKQYLMFDTPNHQNQTSQTLAITGFANLKKRLALTSCFYSVKFVKSYQVL